MKELFYLNNNPPPYDKDKHFFDQRLDTIEFFLEEKKKIEKGITIGGVYISGWLYFHMNYFKTSIPVKDSTNLGSKEVVQLPPLRDNEWFMQENLMEALEKQKFLAMFGTRRFSKSTLEASLGYWSSLINHHASSQMVCPSQTDMDKLMVMVRTNWEYIHPAFKLPLTKSQWSDSVEFGIRINASTKHRFSSMDMMVIDDTLKKSTEKAAGGAPSAFIVDEFGKFSFLKMFEGAMPAFKTPEGLRTLVVFVGTGGNKELSADAKTLMSNPEAWNFLPMNWDRLNNMVDEESLITWKKTNFGIFVPAQMSYEEGLVKKQTNLGDYLKKSSPKLQQIPILVTDWEKSKEVIETNRTNKKGESLSRYKMYYPLDPMDCFLNRLDNPFPASAAQRTLERLESEGMTGKPVVLDWNGEGGVSEYPVPASQSTERIPYPYNPNSDGSINKNAPIFLYKKIPEHPNTNLFVGGNDFYKLKESSTDSVAAFYIFERRHIGNPIETIALSYAARPDRLGTLYSNIEKGLEAFRAKTFVENVDATPFFQYLQGKGKDYRLLVEGTDFSKMINPHTRVKTTFGYYPNDKNKEHVLSQFIEYCNEEVILGQTDDGAVIKKLGVEFITDPDLLKEIINFNWEGNFDRIIAASSALAWCRYLDGLKIPAVPQSKLKEREEKLKKRKKSVGRAMYPLKTRGIY